MQFTFQHDELDAAAGRVVEAVGTTRVILLSGELGAGKTTLTAALCRRWGVPEGQTSSPTFSLVNVYAGADGPIYHLDLYRLADLDEALEIGVEEYLDSGRPCLVEWPEVIEPILPVDVVQLTLSRTTSDRPFERVITIQHARY
ncbi:MAG: tRNA (adenosine(37)-N6)-threonylcarbamoyltransferase complex ATPase subunit type 1 TsaE [Saprospiraceae bacterium]